MPDGSDISTATTTHASPPTGTATSGSASAVSLSSPPTSSASNTMQARFSNRASPHTNPSIPARETDALTPKPHKLSAGSSPKDPPSGVLYDSGVKQAPRHVQADTSPSGSGSSVVGAVASVQDIYSPSARSPGTVFHTNFENPPDLIDRLNSSEPIRRAGEQALTSGDASSPNILNMSEQRTFGQDSGRPPAGRGRSYQTTSRGRGQPGRQQPPVQPFRPNIYLPPGVSDSSTTSTGFQGMHGQYQSSPAPFSQRGPYMGSQYALSPSPVTQQPGSQYTFPNHPGLVSPDTSLHPQNQLVGYSPTTIVPMMQQQSLVYGYPQEGGPTSNSYAGGPSSAPMYPPTHTSPSPHSPHPGGSPYAQAYTPSYIYPPHTFTSSGNTLYQGQFPYGQQYRPPVPVPGEQEGTWWYMPQPASAGPPASHYESYGGSYAMYHPTPQQDADYGAQPLQTGSSVQPAPAYPMSPRQPAPASFSASPSPAAPPPPQPSSRDFPHRTTSEPAKHEAAASSLAPARVQPEQRSVRKPFHPNPPSNRSEWVMWAGNVPSDATHDELWRFFNSSASPVPSGDSQSPGSAVASTPSAAPTQSQGGVLSIFLIQRSNCAFVNFQTDAHLQAAIAFFNGKPLRPQDPRCPRLVCRVRGREDDLKAGVGGQRGAGLHARWIRDQKQRQSETAVRAGSPGPSPSERSVVSSTPSDAAGLLASLSISSDEETHGRKKRSTQHSNSSGSFASTNSSLLSQYFPKRYFILKSLTQFDLDLSVEKGLWATQRHNEGILDQAFRTSKEVYLIFGVNKSGEFYGYARMAGPVLRGEHRVSWASRSSIDSPPTKRSSTSGLAPATPASRRLPQYFSPSEGNRYEDSPLPMETPGQERSAPTRAAASAPAVMLDQHRPLSKLSASVPRHGDLSYNEVRVAPAVPAMLAKERSDEEFELDPTAPARAVKQRTPETSYLDEEGIRRWDAAVGESLLESVKEEEEHQHQLPSHPESPELTTQDKATAGEGKEEGPVWGESFKVEWIKAERLPFYRTRHLRNPWNHDREVKVSRDGTELEPSVGQALLEEWDKPDPQAGQSPRIGTKSTPPEKATGQQSVRG